MNQIVERDMIRREAISDTLAALPQAERVQIIDCAIILRNYVKGTGNGNHAMSLEGAIEVLAAVGAWMVQHERK